MSAQDYSIVIVSFSYCPLNLQPGLSNNVRIVSRPQYYLLLFCDRMISFLMFVEPEEP